jgi:hypothetical protein
VQILTFQILNEVIKFAAPLRPVHRCAYLLRSFSRQKELMPIEPRSEIPESRKERRRTQIRALRITRVLTIGN